MVVILYTGTRSQRVIISYRQKVETIAFCPLQKSFRNIEEEKGVKHQDRPLPLHT